MVTTDGHLLGGRVSYRQPSTGFRSGIEPVLLAASVPAKPGEHVLEAGTGAGAALLCLSARVPEVRATGVEADAAMAGLAMANASSNGFTRVEIIPDRIEAAASGQTFDHALANPPYHPLAGTASPCPSGSGKARLRGFDRGLDQPAECPAASPRQPDADRALGTGAGVPRRHGTASMPLHGGLSALAEAWASGEAGPAARHPKRRIAAARVARAGPASAGRPLYRSRTGYSGRWRSAIRLDR